MILLTMSLTLGASHTHRSRVVQCITIPSGDVHAIRTNYPSFSSLLECLLTHAGERVNDGFFKDARSSSDASLFADRPLLPRPQGFVGAASIPRRL